MKKLLLVCLVLGCPAFADQVNCIKWKDADGVNVGTYCKPFTIKAGSNITFSDNQLTRVMTITAGDTSSISVKTHGALGDGATDDSQAFQEAIDALSSSQSRLYVPQSANCYVIGTSLVGSAYLREMFGDGPGASKLCVPGSSSTNQILSTVTAPDAFKMRGLEFDGPGASAAGGQVGVTIAKSGGNVSDAIFEDLFFKDWPSYGLELDAPITCRVNNVRVLTSMKGIFYNGGTSCVTTNSYMNSITKVGYDVKGAGYMFFSGNAADADGLAYWIRNASSVIGLSANGHERGTARNVTVTNVALTSNVATVTYTGDDLSADFQSGMTIVVNATTSTAGLFNVRAVPTSVTSSTIVYPLTHADVVSAADTGTACLFCGDGIVINNSTGVQVNGFFGIAAQQTYSNHVTVSGTSANTNIENVVSTVGTAGTPVTQTIDIYIGASAANVFRFNTNLVGGITGLSNQIQTYSSNLWTLGGVSLTAATPTVSGSQVAFGTTTGFGAGSAGTAVTTTTKGAGSGPTTPQTIVNYLKINSGGTDYYIPLVQ